MAILTRSEIVTNLGADLADNVSGDIGAADVRDNTIDITESAVFPEDIINPAEVELFVARSFNDQIPVAADTPLQIEFGPAQLGPTDPVQIDALGNITINEAGTYRFSAGVQYGRSGSAGVSILHFRGLFNGTQIGGTGSALIDNADVLTPYFAQGLLTASPTDVINFEIVRDLASVSAGGLYSLTPSTPGWNASPSAFVEVSKLRNAY